MKKLLSFSIFSLLVCLSANAQGSKLVGGYETKNLDQPIRIPVVVHILHEYGTSNISDAKVYEMIDKLNEEFNAADADSADLVPEYQGLNGNAKITFVLASLDPYGNCTNGIEHIYTHESRIGDQYCKMNQWNRSHYLNFWLTDSIPAGNAFGEYNHAYAELPNDVVGSFFWIDGVVSEKTNVGMTALNESIITREVGRFLGLDYTFEGNQGGAECGDDGVSDTPPTAGWYDDACTIAVYPNDWIVCDPYPLITGEGVYSFDSIVPTSGTIDPTPVPEPHVIANDPETSVIYTSFTAVGVGSNPTTTGSFGFNSWDLGAADGETVYTNLSGSINTAKYYEFSLAPEYRGRLNMDALVFNVARDADGPRTFSVRWDIDGYAANLDLTATSSTNANITVDDVADIFFYTYDSTYTEGDFSIDLLGTEVTPTVPVTFRIYAWNAETASGDFIIDDLKVEGAVGLIEDVQNYMDWSSCPRHFTPRQISFMHNNLDDALTAARKVLWQDSTLNLTGTMNLVVPQVPTDDLNNLTVPLCSPVADFYAPNKVVCVGANVDFEDASWNAVVSTRAWEFEGGTPATSNSATPSVSWSTPGFKQVKLTVSNQAGMDTRTETHYIYVSPDWPDFTGPTTWDLEDNQGYSNWFLVENPENNFGKFSAVNTNSAQGKAFKLQTYKDISQADLYTDDFFYNNRLQLSKDILITPSVDLRNTTGVSVSFKYSYATNATLENEIIEQLNVFTSQDCGETWTLQPISVDGAAAVDTLTGPTLVSAGYASNADFTPNAAGQWRTGSFNYTPTASDNKVRVKFEFIASDVSSNLFIDDIMIDGTLGINDATITAMEISIYPNPTNGEAINVTYNAQNEPTEFILRDVQGKIIAQQVINVTNAQVSQELMGTANLAASYYFLEVKTGGSSITKKVVVL